MNTKPEPDQSPIQWLPSMRRKLVGLWAAVPLGVVFNGLLYIIIARSVFEGLLEGEHTLAPDHMAYHKVLVGGAHVTLSWICLFGYFTLLASLFLGIPLSAAFRITALCSPIILIVPFIDYLILGGSDISYSNSFGDLAYNFANLFNPMADITMVSLGVRIEVLLATLGAFIGARVIYKCTIMRAAVFAAAIYVVIFAFGYLPALLPNLVRSSYLSYFPIYIPVFLVGVIAIVLKLRFENAEWAHIVAHLLFPSRLSIYLFLLCFGFLYAASMLGQPVDYLKSDGGLQLVIAALSIAILFAYAKMQNDRFDSVIDAISAPDRPVILKAMDDRAAMAFKGILLVLSFLFAIAADEHFLPIWLLVFSLSALYSEPPFRVRRYYPFGHITLSLVGASVFMAGAELVGSRKFFQISGVQTMTSLVFCGFFCLCHIKDFKDIEGDASDGVVNVFGLTKYPKKLGIAFVCGFAAVLILILNQLAIYGPVGVLMIVGYLGVTVYLIVTARNLMRLDGIILLSFLVMCGMAILWVPTVW